MKINPTELKVRLDTAQLALKHLRGADELPLELQLAICRTLYEIEQLTLQLHDALRTS